MNTMQTFITSDTHFNHKNMIGETGFCTTRKGFKWVEDMNRIIINNWNATVKETDTVYMLGDMGIGSVKEIFELMNQLNGIIYIVKGNHDSSRLLKYLVKHGPMINGQPKFNLIEMGTIIKKNGKQYFLTHYPQGFGEHRKTLRNLCGHIHEEKAADANVLNVGLDSPEIPNEYFGEPILLDDAMSIVDAKWNKWREKTERSM